MTDRADTVVMTWGKALSIVDATLLCAKAMGWTYVPAGPYEQGWRTAHFTHDGKFVLWAHSYDPLNDANQCIELVKKFEIAIDRKEGAWRASLYEDDTVYVQFDNLLNAAVVGCVSIMQAEKHG